MFVSYMALSDFNSRTTQVITKDHHASLDDVYFPSVVVCNINDFRYSFVKYIIDNLKKDGIVNYENGTHMQTTKEEQDVFDLIRGYFFKGFNRNLTSHEEDLKMHIFQSDFYRNYVSRYFDSSMNERLNISSTSYVLLSSRIQEKISYSNGSNEMKERYLDDVFGILATQWEEGEMITNLEWNGDIQQESERSYVYMEQDFGTSDGVCSWVTPLMDNATLSINGDWKNLKKGAYFGQNNGLTIFMDAESFDYVRNNGEGLGFKIAVSHPLDMPIIQGSAVDIKPGFLTELGISTTLTDASSSSIRRFGPYERKCWHSSEINLQFLPYDQGYQYSFSNCLFVATLQTAAKLCHCIPGFIELGGNSCFGRGLKCFNDVFKKLGK